MEQQIDTSKFMHGYTISDLDYVLFLVMKYRHQSHPVLTIMKMHGISDYSLYLCNLWAKHHIGNIINYETKEAHAKLSVFYLIQKGRCNMLDEILRNPKVDREKTFLSILQEINNL